MCLGSNQPYFFPYVGYFQLIESVDTFLLYGNIKYVKESWVSRNRLLNKSTKQPFYIILPIGNRNTHQLISNTKVKWNKQIWIRKFKNTLITNYSGAPFFEESLSFLTTLLEGITKDNLHEFNLVIIKSICSYLRLDTKLIDDSQTFDLVEEKLSKLYSNGDTNHLIARHVQRIFMLCEQYGASSYHNLSGGKHLYKEKEFVKRGINLKFLSSEIVSYKQFNKDFIPQLSIIDVLMHEGQTGTERIVKNYHLS